MRYQTKPPLYFNFNNKSFLNYFIYINNNINNSEIDFKIVSKTITQ